MKYIYWINPFSGLEEKLPICRELINKNKSLKVPEVFYPSLNSAVKLATQALMHQSESKNYEVRKNLMYAILRHLEDNGKYAKRKFDYSSIRGHFRNRSESIGIFFNERDKILGDTNNAQLQSSIKDYQQSLCNLVFNPAHPDGLPKRNSLEISAKEFDDIYRFILKTYVETIGTSKNEDPQRLRRLRERIRRHFSDSQIFQVLRDEATIWRGVFHHEIARCFLDAVKREGLYSKYQEDIFKFLHLENPAIEGLNSPLKFTPPLASLSVYPTISHTYETTYKRALRNDLASCIILNQENNSTALNVFRKRLSLVIDWYLSCYLETVRQYDKDKRNKKVTYNSKAYSDEEFISNDNTDFPDNEEAESRSRIKKVADLCPTKDGSFNYESFKCSLTDKQSETFALYIKGFSWQKIGDTLNITREAARDRIEGVFKKLRSNIFTKK